MTKADTTFSGPFVVTGLSGAGKTVLSRSFEDMGYVCVDNIPLDLVPLLFAQLMRRAGLSLPTAVFPGWISAFQL